MRVTKIFLAEMTSALTEGRPRGILCSPQGTGKASAANRESRCPSFPCLSLLGFAGRAGRLQGPSCSALHPSHLLRRNSTGC